MITDAKRGEAAISIINGNMGSGSTVSKPKDKGEYTMKQKDTWTRWLVLGVGVVCLTFAMNGRAQVQTETSTTTGHATKVVQVEHGQVAYVNGNELVVKMQDGTYRHFNNVPDSARVLVNGQELGIHDLKVGMTLQKTITTTTTPKVVTTTQSVTGTVWHVSPPNSVILRLADNSTQSFKIPKNQKFNVDGQMVDAFGLKKGMKVTATKIVEEPITQVQQEAKLTGQMPPPPQPPPANVPILIVVEEQAAPAQTAQASPPPTLPKTGSPVPLIGLIGLLSLLSAFSLRQIRKGA
jgi:LPXTG-motif cell wall-anchored protein